jgi:hypothetical protein
MVRNGFRLAFWEAFAVVDAFARPHKPIHALAEPAHPNANGSDRRSRQFSEHESA